MGICAPYYTIPSDNRELQQLEEAQKTFLNYTIPSDNRELQHGKIQEKEISIIPYQVITGNYNVQVEILLTADIIPYQVITGNYN